jgi:tyrosine-protein kinase Etk/Wzc
MAGDKVAMDDINRGVSSQSAAASKKPSLPIDRILAPIWANRKRILLVSIAVAAVTLGVNFLLPVYFKATATLLPETDKSKLSALGQFGDIAQLAGVSIPGSEIARLYPTIVTSDTVLRAVIERKYSTSRTSDSINLVQFFGLREGSPEKDMAETLKMLRGLLNTSFENKTGVVSLTLEMREPALAADVLNAIIGELDNFMRSKRTTSASEQVKWIDLRVKQVQQDLRGAEEMLKDFRERNRRVSDSPDLLLQQQRLLRNMEVSSAVFVELKKQYELAKLEEIKNITIVKVLDVARPPVKKDSPKRATNAAIFFFLALGALSAYYGGEPVYGKKLREFWRKVRSRE